MTRDIDDREIRRYLLGGLPEQDENALEAAYFGDVTLLDRIEAVANDLADEYAAGRMSAGDRVQFERRLLASAEGREDVAFARALQRAKRAGEPRTSGAAASAPVWLGWAAVAVVVVGAALLAWQVWSAGNRTVGDAPAVAIAPPATTPSTPSAPPQPERAAPTVPNAPAIRVATLILTTDLARSEGQPPTLIAAPDITHVDLVLPASDGTRESRRGRVESVEGKAVWTGPIEPPTGADTRPRARMPAASLPPGDYLLSVTDGGAYYFRVRAK